MSGGSRASWHRPQRARERARTLMEREQGILALPLGLTREEPLALEEVGKRFGLTRARIRQLEAKALAKLRRPSHSYCTAHRNLS